MNKVLALAFLMRGAVTSDYSVPLTKLHSGHATVHYLRPPGVVLDIQLNSGKGGQIPLSYEQVGQQRRAAIWAATVVAEDLKHFVVFTDLFASNSNIQGECGASDGERFLHVVSLTSPMRETLSVNIDSCYREISTLKTYPRYDPVSHVLTIKTENGDTSVVSVARYRIGNAGAAELLSNK